jgi:hypothetical protein
MSHLQFSASIRGQAAEHSACYSPSAQRIVFWQSIRLWSSPLFAQQHRAFLPYAFFPLSHWWHIYELFSPIWKPHLLYTTPKFWTFRHWIFYNSRRSCLRSLELIPSAYFDTAGMVFFRHLFIVFQTNINQLHWLLSLFLISKNNFKFSLVYKTGISSIPVLYTKNAVFFPVLYTKSANNFGLSLCCKTKIRTFYHNNYLCQSTGILHFLQRFLLFD